MPLPGIAQNIANLTGGDPYFSKVTLLMHFDSTITGTSQYPTSPALTVVSGPTISTSQKLYGPASIYFAGSGDNMYSDDASYWNLPGDFTIEFAFTQNQPNNNRGIVDFRTSSSGQGPLFEQVSGTGGTFHFRINGNNFAQFEIGGYAWNQVAMSRTGSTVSAYRNGTRLGTTTYASAMNCKFTIGTYVDQRQNNTNYHYVGYVDELRVTNGVGRYTGTSYQLQGGPFPNYGE
jgi:hypothetical protein